jgi:4-hydroxybenzoate polyprenyltransferase
MPDSARPHNGVVADAVRGHWADRLLPEAWKPYARLARLERPIGWWLLLWPCWWASVMATTAAGSAPNPWHLVLFLVGAIVMRGAGCTWNDILDRDLDARVARTRSRPLPSGQVTLRQAVLFLLAQVVVGLVVLLRFNLPTVLLGLLSVAVVAVYPLMKRVTWWPQVFLGLAFSWGALIGWSAVHASLGFASVLLYGGSILWVIGYDTIYAHQDREDDALVGVKSAARLLGRSTKPVLALLYAGATALFAAAFASAGMGLPAYLGLAAGALQLTWQVVTVDIDDPDSCLAVFRANTWYGWILFAGLVTDGLLRVAALR